MIWASYVEFSRHMWGDEYSPVRFTYLPAGTTGELYGYTENNEVDLATWDMAIKDLADRKFNTAVIDLGDAVKWESHPEICAPDAWSKDFMKKKLDEIRALGMTPIPKMNFSACHQTWLKEYRRMVGTTIYRKVCADLITEACELFDHPALFHLGLDEESSEGCHMYQDAIIIRNAKLLWEDYHFLMDVCFKNGARPWMWADYFWDRPELFAQNVSKEVLISNWYYNNFKEYKEESWIKRSMEAYEKLEKLGYDQIPTCSTCSGNNSGAFETMTHCKKYIDPSRLKGYLTASWLSIMPDEEYALKNDSLRFFRARQAVYPETL